MIFIINVDVKMLKNSFWKNRPRLFSRTISLKSVGKHLNKTNLFYTYITLGNITDSHTSDTKDYPWNKHLRTQTTDLNHARATAN